MPGDMPVTSAPPRATTRPQSVPVQTMPVAPGGAVTQPLPTPGSVSGNVPPVAATNASAGDTHLVTLTTRLDGASAVPPTSSNATAQIDLVYDTSTRLLRWKADWASLSSPITGVRFYGPAAQGQQGQPALIWPGPFGSIYWGQATLTPQQAANLMGGLWYVSVSTVNYPGGEIRGQVRVVY